MTLKELWEQRGLSATQVAGLADISPPTLYKMNRKEPVARRNIAKVCEALKITRVEYDQLEPEKGN